MENPPTYLLETLSLGILGCVALKLLWVGLK